MRLRCFLYSLIVTAFLFYGCGNNQKKAALQSETLKIAFMPDVHFHDVFADIDGHTGLPITHHGENKKAFIRTMEAQLTSTRMFNENYFAFMAALDDAVDRGIKRIAMPGDFSDDGQPAHIKGLADLLNKYKNEHDLQFFIVPGNHDPARPFTAEAGKRNFLGADGRPQPVYSENHPFCIGNTVFNQQSTPLPHDVICTDEIKMLGYEGLFTLLGDFGLKPDETTMYYETPFAIYDSENDSFSELGERFGFSERQYEICHEGAGGEYRQPHYTNCFDVMDMSYLVEPAEGLWLLAIDANVYIPVENADQNSGENPSNFAGSGNAGYNRVITHKRHLLDWIEDVAKRAENKNKTLIAFSHFPAADFYNGADQKIEEIWGEGRFQLSRVPEKETRKALAATGLKLHIGGHMHMNDTSVAHDPETGNRLFSIQSPSLSAYIPAYKIVKIGKSPELVEVETIILDEVPHFDTFFPLYQDEWDYLDSIGYEGIWNREILNSASYREFTGWHIRELSRLRFLPREWPEKIRSFLMEFSGCDMLAFSQLEIPSNGANNIAQMISDSPDLWREAGRKAEKIAEQAGIEFSEFCQWNGKDLSVDFYRLRNADELALRDISASRLEQYSLIGSALADTSIFDDANPEDLIFQVKKWIGTVFDVMRSFSNGLPAAHFIIDLNNGEINDLTEDKARFSY